MARFVFTLIDRFSGPARGIERTLDRMSGALAKADAATATTRTEKALAALRGGLERASFGVRLAFGDKAADTLDKFTKGELKTAEKAEIVRRGFGAMGGAALGAASALATLGAAALGFAAAGGKVLLSAQSFRDTTQAALGFALGSAQAGADTYGEILRISGVLGASSAEAAANFRELTSAGFGARESKILLQLADDLKAANGGQAVALASIAEPLQALKRNEALTVDSFKALEAAGMGRDQVYKTLAKELGVAIKNPDDANKIKLDVDRALQSRRLVGQKAVDFWAKVNMGALDVAKLGEKGQGFRQTTVAGSLDLLQNRWENFKASLSGGTVDAGLVSLLQRVAAALDPATETGRELLGYVRGIATEGTRLASVFGGSFFAGFDEARLTVRQLGEELGFAGSSALVSAGALSNIGKALGYIVVGVGLTVGALGWLGATIIEAVGTLPDNMRFIGREMVAGLGEGIESAKGWLVAKLESLAALLPESVRKLLQIRSPSRVMMRLGAHTAEGFAQGVEGGAPQVQEASRGMVAAAQGGASGGAGPSTGASARPPVILPPGFVQITINGPADVDAIESRIRAAMIAAFREMGLELGAAV